MSLFTMMPYQTDRDFAHMMNDFFTSSAQPSTQAFRVDIRDAGSAYVLEAELPGFAKEEIGLDLKDDVLTITARHTSSGDKEPKGSYLCRERRPGPFSRAFDVSGISQDHITAAYQNGVLTLTLPKKRDEIPQPRRIAID